MITDDKIVEIRKKVHGGTPEGEIKEELMREGYSNEDIAKAFAPHHYDMRSWYLFFGIILLLSGIWLVFNKGSILGVILSGLLFWQYAREGNRLKKRKISS